MPATAATTAPLEAVFKREEVMPVIAREVVVALVPVAFMKVKFCRVEEALTSNCWKEEATAEEVAVMYEVSMLSPTIALPDTDRFL